MKKRKKRPSTRPTARQQAAQDELADRMDRERKRMDPTARTLLLGDMVFLAVCQLLAQWDMLSDFVNLATTVLAVVLLLLALFFQFRGDRRGL